MPININSRYLFTSRNDVQNLPNILYPIYICSSLTEYFITIKRNIEN